MVRIVTLLLALALGPAALAADATQAVQFAERFASAYPSTAAAALRAIPQQPASPALKAEALVQGEIVRIGDLIENAGAVADVAIFRAPDLGQTGSVPASRVIEAVRPHHIVGLDTRGIAEVVVTRLSRTIAAKDIEARVAGVLGGHHGLADASDLTVSFDNPVRPLEVEAAAGGELRVTRLAFEPRSRRFDVSFDLPGSAAARRLPLRFTGTVTETVEVLSPVRPVAQGTVLAASDLVAVRRPRGELSANVLTKREHAVGQAARRALRPGEVIRQSDLTRPDLVQRSEIVTITYAVPGIVLSLRGQALEAGALGDVVNVLNVQTKKTIQAVVSGPGQVSVATTTPRVANASSRNPR